MSAITVPAAYKKLVILLGHLFYSGQCPPAWWVDAAEPKKQENPAEAELPLFEEKKASQLAREAKRKAQQDTTGLGIVLLTALVEKQWVEEDVLARDLNLPPKMVRKAMRYFEQEQLLQREHKKEGKRARKRERELMVQAGLRPAPGADGQGLDAEEEDEGIVAGRIISYCALDYPRMLDSVRWRLAMMKKNLQKQIRGGATLQQYRCPNAACGKSFNSMDVFNLMPTPGSGSRQLSCDICGSEIEMIIDEGAQTLGSMEDRKERIRTARAMLEVYDAALAPLTTQLAACEGLTPPDFLSYNGWVHNEIAIRQRVQTIDAEGSGAAARLGAQARPEVHAGTKVSVTWHDSTADHQGAAAAGTQGAGLPAAAAATATAGGGSGRGAAAGLGGAAAGSGSTRAVPPWLQSQQQQQQRPNQPASKPLPPWLMSAYKQQQQQHGHPKEQQQQQGPAADPGVGVPKVEGLGLKPEPGLGLKEEVKAEPKQEAEAVEQDDWEAVSLGGAGSDGTAAAAAAGVADGEAAGDDAEDEDWEDV